MKKSIKLITLIAISFSLVLLTSCKVSSGTGNAYFKYVKSMPIGDSDKKVDVYMDSETGVQYFIYEGSIEVRSSGGIKPMSGR